MGKGRFLPQLKPLKSRDNGASSLNLNSFCPRNPPFFWGHLGKVWQDEIKREKEKDTPPPPLQIHTVAHLLLPGTKVRPLALPLSNAPPSKCSPRRSSANDEDILLLHYQHPCHESPLNSILI